ncbi:checkpoint protein HUS1 [Ischnura elegans]|uniref:checkpoint protein HUS1 n=1 Tax=Ischnura elegans TaxID=197161 RepID=UPI001ED8A8F0|nr:checkpoint protein HUS1 [Ischnura elegans]
MKFRGKMIELLCIRQFTNVVMTLAKISKLCTIRITPEKLYFIVLDEKTVRGMPTLWCVMKQAHFFNEYNMVGVSSEHNEIYLSFNPDMLAKPLSSLKFSHTAKSVKVKLTNKQSPCLTFEIELPSSLALTRQCVHDIPVSVIPRREWGNYQEPTYPSFDIGVRVPNIKLVRNVVDRMKTMSPNIYITAGNGAFTLTIETDAASVSTHFKGVYLENVNGITCDMPAGQTEVTAKVDIKKLSLFLFCEQINPSKVVCYISEDKLVYIYLEHEDVIYNFFIAAKMS